ncbi:hypothetical protein [Cohnella zeiphila]|uniref:DUF2759 domain-containing protein n=1 Tax=Cohnella zeiphila TaxID=2761120 RepID=A0A7X0SQR6_9BACL|nr:hypothetical protein [Cohnella zeiphila]MBB6732183.1 hypothetical protein [Cohnella zeiphila]
MFLADNAAEGSTSLFTPFDVFMVIFTVVIAIGFFRLLVSRDKKNIFALGFTLVALVIFLVADVKMVSGW